MVFLHLLEELLGDGDHVPVLLVVPGLELHGLVDELLALLGVGGPEDGPEEVLLGEVVFVVVWEEVLEAWELLEHEWIDSSDLQALVVGHRLLVGLGVLHEALLLRQDLLHEPEGAVVLLGEVDLAWGERGLQAWVIIKCISEAVEILALRSADEIFTIQSWSFRIKIIKRYGRRQEAEVGEEALVHPSLLQPGDSHGGGPVRGGPKGPLPGAG